LIGSWKSQGGWLVTFHNDFEATAQAGYSNFIVSGVYTYTDSTITFHLHVNNPLEDDPYKKYYWNWTMKYYFEDNGNTLWMHGKTEEDSVIGWGAYYKQ
jgi:hypothetical protein